jgi:hypothetical protein
MRGAVLGFARAAKNQNLAVKQIKKQRKHLNPSTNQMLLFASTSPYPEA